MFEGAYDAPIAIATAVFAGDATAFASVNAQPESRFEFGSIGKTMTAQVLAALVVDGAVTLEDPIGTWIDGGDNGAITLDELATHTSGLPRTAKNADTAPTFDPLDPYAAYSADMAEAALRELVRQPKRDSYYSNFGFQLLNVALERAAKAPFDELLQRHVFEPFGLTTASVGPGPNQVQAYAAGKPTPPWRVALPGPGGMNGTIADVLAWGRAVLDPPAGPHGDALSLALEPRVGDASGRVGLGWHFLVNGVIWHNGSTYGSRTCLAIDPTTRRVAACLAAAGDLEFVDPATFLAANGRDPSEARPQPAGDERHDDALGFVAALVEKRWTDAQAAMTESCRDVLTVERLSDAWAQVMGPLGAHDTTTVRAASQQGAITEVTVDLTFADGTGVATVHYDANAKVAGVRIA